MNTHHDVPLLHGSFTLRSPRSVLLLNPYQLPLTVLLLAVSLVFTFWPEVLEHDPVAFETRGLVHHGFHYLLLSGSALTLAGMMSAGPRRLKVELVGLCFLAGALLMNMVALIAHATTPEGDLSGLMFALELAGIVGLVIRGFIVVREPTVDLRANQIGE